MFLVFEYPYLHTATPVYYEKKLVKQNKQVFYVSAQAKKLVFGQILAHVMVWVLCNMLYRFLVLKDPYLHTQHSYVLEYKY